MSESQINHVQLVVIALFAGSLLLGFTLRRLRHNRPDLHIGRPIWTAFAVRIFAAFLVSGTSIASQLRGGDENTFSPTKHLGTDRAMLCQIQDGRWKSVSEYLTH